jgi:hypothetical protein
VQGDRRTIAAALASMFKKPLKHTKPNVNSQRKKIFPYRGQAIIHIFIKSIACHNLERREAQTTSVTFYCISRGLKFSFILVAEQYRPIMMIIWITSSTID